MVNSRVLLIFFFLLFCIFLNAQKNQLGNFKVKPVTGYNFFSLDYDSNLRKYQIRKEYFINITGDTFCVIGVKNLYKIQSEFYKFKYGEFRNPQSEFHKNILSLYWFTNNNFGVDSLHGEFYENSFGQLFMISKVYNRGLIFFNPQSDIFKLIFGNYYNKPPFIYMIKPKKELEKLTKYDIKKLNLKISKIVVIPFEI